MLEEKKTRENILTLLSVEDLAVFKKHPEKCTIDFATDIGLQLIQLSKKDNFPIRLATYEQTKKGAKPKIVNVLEIDLEKPIKTK